MSATEKSTSSRILQKNLHLPVESREHRTQNYSNKLNGLFQNFCNMFGQDIGTICIYCNKVEYYRRENNMKTELKQSMPFH